MGQKLGAFLRVMGSALNPDVAASNRAQFAQEEAAKTTSEQANVKQAFASYATKLAAIQQADFTDRPEEKAKAYTALGGWAKKIASEMPEDIGKNFLAQAGNEAMFSEIDLRKEKEKAALDIVTLTDPTTGKSQAFTKQNREEIESRLEKGWLPREKQGRGGYVPLQEVVIEGKTYKVPYNVRTGKYQWDEKVLLSPADPTQQAKVAGAKEISKAGAKRTFNMGGLKDVVSQARNILTGKETGEKPTASGIGALSDAVAGFFGASLEGATEATMLDSLGGALTSKMPRMEGPQSDRDIELYKQMAARIGDRKLPTEQRLKALDVVERIWGKYEKLQDFSNGAESSGGWKIREVKK